MPAKRCTRCGECDAPHYHEWCAACYGAWRVARRRARLRADPALREWQRVWQRLRMRAYRGHEMAEEACRTCGRRPANLMLLGVTPPTWVWLCRADRERQYPNRTVIGRPKQPPRRETTAGRRRLAAEVSALGL